MDRALSEALALVIQNLTPGFSGPARGTGRRDGRLWTWTFLSAELRALGKTRLTQGWTRLGMGMYSTLSSLAWGIEHRDDIFASGGRRGGGRPDHWRQPAGVDRVKNSLLVISGPARGGGCWSGWVPEIHSPERRTGGPVGQQQESAQEDRERPAKGPEGRWA